MIVLIPLIVMNVMIIVVTLKMILVILETSTSQSEPSHRPQRRSNSTPASGKLYHATSILTRQVAAPPAQELSAISHGGSGHIPSHRRHTETERRKDKYVNQEIVFTSNLLFFKGIQTVD